MADSITKIVIFSAGIGFGNCLSIDILSQAFVKGSLGGLCNIGGGRNCCPARTAW